VVAAASLAAGCGGGGRAGDWPLPNGDLAGTRAALDAEIDSGDVGRLRVRWRFRFHARRSYSGIFASTPIVDGDTFHPVAIPKTTNNEQTRSQTARVSRRGVTDARLPREQRARSPRVETSNVMTNDVIEGSRADRTQSRAPGGGTGLSTGKAGALLGSEGAAAPIQATQAAD
jgi:hypothetical protein